jgi:hypothetical protein
VKVSARCKRHAEKRQTKHAPVGKHAKNAYCFISHCAFSLELDEGAVSTDDTVGTKDEEG